MNQNYKSISNVKELEMQINKYDELRKTLAYDTDGVVIKVNEFELYGTIGYTSKFPKWATAYKFQAEQVETVLKDITFQIGRTGVITPVAELEPVFVSGSTVARATLHNEDEIIRKDIRIADTVTVERAGDVIPHVVSVDLKKRKQNSKKFIFPLKCPSCGSKTIKDYNEITKRQDAVRRCASEGFECEKIAIERIKHFVSKDAFNIDGFGKKIVENFWNLKLVRLPQDIFKLNYNKIEELEGWGKLSVANLKFSIEEKKNISLPHS